MTAKPSTLNSPSEFYAKVIPDVNHIQLVWTSEPEIELDSLTGYRDFEGYRLYRSTDGGITWGDAQSRIYDFEGNFGNRYRRKDGYYDVLVPGSGGKDSRFVSHILKHKYKMNPLTCTWAPHIYTDIGWKNKG